MDVTNAMRADWALKAVEAFRRECAAHEEDDETMIGDLLTNLAHLARRKGLDPRVEFHCAMVTFNQEEAEDA